MTPYPFPTFEPTLGKFVKIHVEDGRRLAVSVDRRSYMELTRDYRQNCRVGEVTICQGDTPIYERSRKTCLSSLYFNERYVHDLCTRLVLREGFTPIFRKLALSESWLYVVEEQTMVETRCPGAGHRAEEIQIHGAGVLHPTAGCDLYVDRIRLPGKRQFESRTEWPSTLLVVHTSPAFLPQREVVSIRAHQEQLDDIYEQWAAGSEEPDLAAQRTTTQLIHQLEARARTRRWVLVGTIGGLITLVTVISGLYLTRSSQVSACLRRRRATPKRQDAAKPVERGTPMEEASADPQLQPQERETSAEDGPVSRYPTSVFQR
jgi:hypothetical protein